MIHQSSNAPEGYVEVCSLPLGGTFRTEPNPADGSRQVGYLLAILTGCVQVRLKGSKQRVKIGDAEFDAQKSKSVYWAPETPVEYLGEILDLDLQPEVQPEEATIMPRGVYDRSKSTASKSKSTAAASKSKSAAVATTASIAPKVAPAPKPVPVAAVESSPKARALQARWKMAVLKLGELLKVDGPTIPTVEARDRVRAIYDEAVSAQVLLTASVITYADPVYTDLELDESLISTSVAAGTPGTPSTSVTFKEDTSPAQDDTSGESTDHYTKEADMANKKSTTGKTAKKKSAAAAAPRKPKATVDPHQCLDGCGAVITSKAKFVQGHDAKYRSMVLKVERGEMKQSEIPAGMRKSGGKDGAGLEFKQLASGLLKCVNSVLNH